MEHLSKQQIILLTLLVSFVTSIATGIVTVSLMDQAPMGVTQTINRVVERTIEKVVSDSSAQTAKVAGAGIGAVDITAEAVEKVYKSLVRIKPQSGGVDTVTGLGIVVSKEGVIVTDKASVAPIANPVAVFHDGQQFPIQVIQSQIDGDIVFVVPLIPTNEKDRVIIPATFSSSIKLGQAVLALSGKNADSLSQGIMEKVDGELRTSIDGNETMIGSPLFTATGEIIGFKTTSLLRDNSFYSMNLLKSSIPGLVR